MPLFNQAIYNAQKNIKKSNEIFQNTVLFVFLNIIIVSASLIIFFLLKNLAFLFRKYILSKSQNYFDTIICINLFKTI